MPKILIIEDNDKLAVIIQHHLASKGLDADIASDGSAAIDAFFRTAYDLLLVDIRLPGMNGDEVCRRVRASEAGRDIPIIMMSGVIQDPDEIEKLKRELQVRTFLAKPFHSETLYVQIMTMLQARAAGPAATPRPPQAPAASNMPPAIKGDLDRIPFEQILLYLMFKRASGWLTLVRGEQRRRFSFIDGAAVEVDLLSSDDDFGHYLARRNLVNRLEQQAYEERRSRDGQDPRDLFIKMGCLTPLRFEEENRSFLLDRLIECFSWRTGSVLFEHGPAVVRTAPVASAFMPSVFYHGFRAHIPPARISSFLKDKGNLYASKTAEFYEYQNHLAHDLPGTGLFDLVNGMMTVSGIVTAFDADDAAIVLYTLDYLKLLSYHPEPKRSKMAPPFPVRERQAKQPEKQAETFEDISSELTEMAEEIENLEILSEPAEASGVSWEQASIEEDLRRLWEEMKEKNYYELFGMTAKTFSFEKMKEAYFSLTRAYGPEKFFASSGEVLELAEEFLSRLSNAYATLSDVVSKENYDGLLASKAPAGAEEKKFYEQVQYQSGKVLLEKGQFDSAEKTFTTCINLNPDKPEYQVYLAIAMYHNPANRENPSAIKKAKDLVNRSLQWEKLAIAYALKGQMLLDEGLVNLAESEFNKALRLNDKNKTALKGLEVVRQKREEEEKKGGLFTRMFK
jgi:DNA-binding response OmpR family regulator/tetratricopeptide (TPR) repeat protein